MAELFLEFFTEEMPASLQSNARENLLRLIKDSFEKNDIVYKLANSYSTPNRLVIYFDGIPKQIKQKAVKIKGPRVGAHESALGGFIKSNNIDKKDIKEENTDKGKFYFASIKPKVIKSDFIFPVLQGKNNQHNSYSYTKNKK